MGETVVEGVVMSPLLHGYNKRVSVRSTHLVDTPRRQCVHSNYIVNSMDVYFKIAHVFGIPLRKCIHSDYMVNFMDGYCVSNPPGWPHTLNCGILM